MKLQICRLFLIILVAWSISVLRIEGDCVGSITEIEYEALKQFYISSNGPYWVYPYDNLKLSKWSFPSPLSDPCSIPWQGLNCSWNGDDHKNCNVVSIEFQDANMTGKLSPYLANLTHLDTLALANNTLSGQLPVEYASMQYLSYLYFPDNVLTGTIPSQYGMISSLYYLALYQNRIGGSIPTELGLLTNMNLLALQENEFTGTIPSELGLLTGLQTLYLYQNMLTFTIPSELGNLGMVQKFEFQNNSLTGVLPISFGGLVELIRFDAEVNMLSGPIPPELKNMEKLSLMGLSNNLLTSSIPSEIGDMKFLTQMEVPTNLLTNQIPYQLSQPPLMFILDLDSNMLSGTIPDEFFAGLKVVSIVNIGLNKLSGTFPSSVESMTKIEEFFLTANSLTGTLPSQISSLSNCVFLYVDVNSLTGTYPSQLGNMTHLKQMSLEQNLFTGSIPLEFGSLSSVQLLGVSINLLTGNLPTTLGLLTQMEAFYSFDNFLTGSLVPELGVLSGTKQFLFSFNLFSGQLPDSISNCTSLLEMYADSNLLTGSIPASYGNLTLLSSFNLSSNMLEGSFLETLFVSNESVVPFPSLRLLDLSQNGLSGSLPPELFNRMDNNPLQSLILFQNCFSGSLPAAICASSGLEVLVLDSISSAGSCTRTLPAWLRNIFAGKISANRFYGSIPSCLWSISSLQVLHMSSNALTGTLGDIYMSNLSDVSLSNNMLIGTIPDSLQQLFGFTQLDLANNRLTGLLSPDMQVNATATQLDLTVNRLSGQIPSSLYGADQLNILDGNLFQCQVDHMPASDPDSNAQQCGAKNFNDAIIVWATLLMFCVLCLVVFLPASLIPDILSFDAFLSKQHEVASMMRASLMESIIFFKFLNRLTVVMVVVTVFSATVGIIMYVSLKLGSNHYSTHTEQYTWTTTASFLHGSAPAALCTVFYVLCALGMIFAIWNFHRVHEINAIVDQNIKFCFCFNWRSFLSKSVLFVNLVLLMHAIVTVIVNVLYVFALLDHNLNSLEIAFIQLLLGMFKLLWAHGIGRLLYSIDGLSCLGEMIAHTSMYLIAFIGGPFIATFFSEDTCFHQLVVGEAAVSSQFNVETLQCGTVCYSLRCDQTCAFDQLLNIQTSAVPNWNYSFQCTSALLLDYVPVLLLSYSMSGLLMPLLALISAHPPPYIGACLPESWRYALTEVMIGVQLDNMHVPVYSHSDDPLAAKLEQDFVRDHHEEPHYIRGDDGQRQYLSPRVRVFNSSHVVAKFFVNWTILLTFGLASPVLAAAIAVDTCSMLMLWRVTFRRLVNFVLADVNPEASGSQVILTPLRRLEESAWFSCKGTQVCPQGIGVICAGFWALFVIDMVGDVYGSTTAINCIIAFLTVSAVAFSACSFLPWPQHAGVPTTRSESSLFGGSLFGESVPTSRIQSRATNESLRKALLVNAEGGL